MDTVGTTTLNEDQQQGVAAEFERSRLEQSLAKRQQAKQQQKTQRLKPDPGGELAEKALEALRKSPAGFNPIVRIILLVNNLLNRMRGKPPDSAETLTMVTKVVVPMIILMLIIYGSLVLFTIAIIGHILLNPVESIWCGIKVALGGSCI